MDAGECFSDAGKEVATALHWPEAIQKPAAQLWDYSCA
jgi:hypothetical protein